MNVLLPRLLRTGLEINDGFRSAKAASLCPFAERKTTITGRTILTTFFLAVFACLYAMASPVSAQQLPRENVIDVPAMGHGLCVSNVFQSGMVLQREKPIRIWGWAAPSEQVTVEFAGQQLSTIAEADRRWTVTLTALPANDVPQQMSIRGADASLQLDNILIGDVWLLGGQSNMEFELAKVENGNLEIVSANYPQMRILTVPYGQGPELQSGFARLHEWSDWFGRHFRKGEWNACTPEIARELSAIGYVFARRIHMASKVPIGVIDVSRGGTTVETWTPLPVLRAMDSEPTRARLAKFD
ncbi:MAG: hypothetical protein KDA96_27920, partial [Planctomycetaceae bacterium]|nr:hypothetical protein [Planctomycetaceae bacterium]